MRYFILSAMYRRSVTKKVWSQVLSFSLGTSSPKRALMPALMTLIRSLKTLTTPLATKRSVHYVYLLFYCNITNCFIKVVLLVFLSCCTLFCIVQLYMLFAYVTFYSIHLIYLYFSKNDLICFYFQLYIFVLRDYIIYFLPLLLFF